MVSFCRISPNSFLSSILLLVVVMVILVVIVVAIVEVVIVVAIIGVVVEIMIIVEITIFGIVVVVSGVPSIIKLSFAISGFLHRITLYQTIKFIFHFLDLGWAYAFHQDKASSVRVPVSNVTLSSSAHLLRENTDSVGSNQRMRPTTHSVPLKQEDVDDITEILEFKASRDRHGDNEIRDSIRGVVFLVNLTDDDDPTDEDGDVEVGDLTGVLVSLGDKISSGGKKSRESNIDDSDNTRDGGKQLYYHGKQYYHGEQYYRSKFMKHIFNLIEPLPEDILGVTTLRDTLSYYPKRYWEILPKEILGDTTQRDIGRYYPKRFWESLPEDILGVTTLRDTSMYLGNNISG
ncbi:hypothetical protein Tco_1173174 [Tanacetum coccineum]